MGPAYMERRFLTDARCIGSSRGGTSQMAKVVVERACEEAKLASLHGLQFLKVWIAELYRSDI